MDIMIGDEVIITEGAAKGVRGVVETYDGPLQWGIRLTWPNWTHSDVFTYDVSEFRKK